MNETPKFAKGRRVRIGKTYVIPPDDGREGIVIGPSTRWGMEHWIEVKLEPDGESPGFDKSFHPDSLELIPETPKFKKGDKVRFTAEANVFTVDVVIDSGPVLVEGRACGVEYKNTNDGRWFPGRAFELIPAERPADPPKFKPGDEVIVEDPGSAMHGKRLILDRRSHDRHGAYWTTNQTAQYEVCLRPTPDADIFAPRPRYDPREPEAVAMKAPSFHDGQANTSGIQPPRSAVEDVFIRPGILPGTPSVYTVQEGIARWQQADPAHRRVDSVLKGHAIGVQLTVLPGLSSWMVKFFSPRSAEDTVKILEDAAKSMAGHADAEVSVTMARNPAFRFSEDSGEIEP